MKHYPLDVAHRALALWRGDPDSLEHLATSGNDIYRFRTAGTPYILRLTDPDYRSAAENDAEMAFLEHLREHGVAANAPVRSTRGARVETVEGASASVLTWAPGQPLQPGGPETGELLLREWGKHLAMIHEAATRYDGPARWHWPDERLIARADRLFARDDSEVRTEFAAVLSRLAELPRAESTYGMTHADFGYQNFHWSEVHGIVSFDYGNCCLHWFVMDLAISLTTLRRMDSRDRLRDWMLEGYRSVRPIDPEAWRQLGWFIRLRVLYVYLSRLWKFGPQPTDDEAEILRGMRGLVVDGLDWPVGRA